jgi:pimeloyl-ACP methyl ester carboxylesterase
MKTFISHIAVAVVMFSVSAMPSIAIGDEAKVGIVLLHGNGHPTKHIEGLVRKLESSKFLVALPEMPWSENRRYDAPVDDAVGQVNAALDKLKELGAKKLFIAGHSKGGVFALYYASNHPVDGLIAIAPGGNVGGKKFRNKLGSSVKKAENLIASGEGNKKATFHDLEGARGVTDVQAPPAAYLTWFDPDGAMNSKNSAKRISANVPILWIVAKDDYEGLKKVNIPMFDLFPSNAKTRFYEPSTGHQNAPLDAADEIIEWVSEVSNY